MTRHLTLTSLICLIVLSLGCKSVTTEQLIGVPLDAETAEEYDGIWKLGDTVFFVQHEEDDDEGELEVAHVEHNDNGFELNQSEAVLTRHHDMRFIHFVDEEDEDDDAEGDEGDDEENEPWILLGIVSEVNDDALVLFLPNYDRFEQALNENELAGELEDDGNTIHLQCDKETLDDYMSPDRFHEFFEMNQPGIMTRIGDVD